MGCPIDMERKGCKSTECWTHVVTFNFDFTHDLHLEFSTSNYEIAVSLEWEGRRTWMERDMSRWGAIPTLWPWAMTLNLDFQGQIITRRSENDITLSWPRSENANISWEWPFHTLIHFMVNWVIPPNFMRKCDFLNFIFLFQAYHGKFQSSREQTKVGQA